MSKKLTTKDFIKKAQEIHGNVYCYDDVGYETTHVKVLISCKEHGEFKQTPAAHLQGQGCPKCGVVRNAKNRTKTTKQFIKEAKNVHGNRYNYYNCDYKGSYDKVNIKCPDHGNFQQTPNMHVNGGQGCPDCGLHTKNDKLRKGTTAFIEESIEVHGDVYDYSKVEYCNIDKKVVIICPKHGEFKQTPYSHLKGHGCLKCGYEKTKGKITKNFDKFIEESNKLHNYKYDYSKANYINSKTKIKIVCPTHGTFEQTPSGHLKGGCFQCGHESVDRNSNTKEFISKAKTIHSDKYNYKSVDYKSARKNVEIICPIHGSFTQTPNKHLGGAGCPRCGYIKTSEYQKENPSGWSYTNWIDASKKSKNFDSYKIYVVKLFNKSESFYKIGRTYNKIKDRLHSIPYEYEIIYIIEEAPRKVCELEQELKEMCKNFSYVPNEEFGGMYECFRNINPINHWFIPKDSNN